MIVTLGSWSILFAAMFFSFAYYRTRLPVWPPPEFIPFPQVLPAINTGVIILSSVLFYRGENRLTRGHHSAFFRYLLGTTALAGLFFALQSVVWNELWSHDIQLATGVYASFFYLLTVFHGLHVIAGLGLLLWLIAKAKGPATPRQAIRVKLVGLFWHFVGVVWVLTYLLVFVV